MLDDWIKFATDQSDKLQTYWNILLVLAIGVFTAATAIKGHARRNSLAAGFSIIYIAVAMANFQSMERLSDQQEIYLEGIHLLLKGSGPASVAGQVAKLSTTLPINLLAVGLFHTLLDLAVLASIWLVVRVPQKHNTTGKD